ncbi:MAG TPA: cytochrome c oxidase subunit 4 [Acidimicrobiales bacterium]|nr:cytochrome c oxidase subunit 4 [Acidimicrobiales bacterium]
MTTSGEHRVPGTEGYHGHEARPPVDDRKVPWRVFGAIGAFVLLMAVIYWVASYEASGIVLLLLASGLSLWIGTYLWLLQRRESAATVEARAAGEALAAEGAALPGAGVDAHHDHYLPHSSVWPFAIGLGAATLANGLVLGLWVIVPGAVLMALGLGGFVRQTRRRD